MGRWVVFFIFMFGICTYATAAAGGGGGYAVTYLTADMSSGATSMTVANNKDFLQNASVARPAYIQVDDEIMYYAAAPPDSTHINTITRGQADPSYTPSPNTTSTSHKLGTRVRTLDIALIDSFMGTQITTSDAGFGAIDAFVFLGKMFTAVPKLISWNYPVLNQGMAIYFKYFVLYALSAGFVVTLVFGFITLAWGIFKP